MKTFIRTTLLILFISALILGLAALVYKTRSLDPALHQSVNVPIQTLENINAQWDVDVLRSREGLNANYDRLTNSIPTLRQTQITLKKIITELNDSKLEQANETLNGLLEQKIALIDNFKSQHALLRNSLRFLPTAVEQLDVQLASSPMPSPSTDTATTTLSYKELGSLATELLTDILKFNALPDVTNQQQVETLISRLENLDADYPLLIKDQLSMIMNHARTILMQRESEDAVLAESDALPVEQSLSTLVQQFENYFATLQQEHDQWSKALNIYAVSLLGLLLLTGINLWRSYRSLDQANALLEQRVKERTAELTRTLEQLKESQLQLVQSEKMASLGQMVAGIAHEINTPLAYVKGGLEIINTRITDMHDYVAETQQLMSFMSAPEGESVSEETLAEQFALVQDITSAFIETEAIDELKALVGDGLYGIEHIAEIVRNLKDFSRLDRARVDEFNVNEGIKSTLSIARNIVKYRRIDLQLADVPSILCAPSQINQVFLNLINNACQATNPETGLITITTASAEQGVIIKVADNGSGIAPEVLGKIFDPFFTTKKVGEGTGLGLSIVQRIIKEHGGRMSVESTVGQGTCFTVWLPQQHQPILASEPIAPMDLQAV